MKTEKKTWLFHMAIACRRFFSFFLMMCFVITCNVMLFFRVMSRTMGIELERADIRQAAMLTFANVVLLSLLCAGIDELRRQLMVERPVKKIIQASEKVMKGDFSVRIAKLPSLDPQDGFNTVIDYLNRMIEELAGIETLQTDFIANVSHELKTPLAVIQNYAAMLRQTDLPPEKRREYADTIAAAAENLSRMVSNILFTDAGGTVSVSLRAEGDRAVVRVADTGCGISPEVGKHIFEKFYQGDTSHAEKGNGLGLAMVKRVMHILGGEISVESKVGAGSVFTVTLHGAIHEARWTACGDWPCVRNALRPCRVHAPQGRQKSAPERLPVWSAQLTSAR